MAGRECFRYSRRRASAGAPDDRESAV